MWCLWVIFYFAAAVVGHAILCRFPLAWNSVWKFIPCGLGLGIALVVQECLLQGFGIETWAAVLLYGFSCELYIFLFTLVSTSISVSVLLTLRTSSLTPAEIGRFCSSSYMFERCIKKLLDNGFVAKNSSSYIVTARGRILLALFRPLRTFFRHRDDDR